MGNGRPVGALHDEEDTGRCLFVFLAPHVALPVGRREHDREDVDARAEEVVVLGSERALEDVVECERRKQEHHERRYAEGEPEARGEAAGPGEASAPG